MTGSPTELPTFHMVTPEAEEAARTVYAAAFAMSEREAHDDAVGMALQLIATAARHAGAAPQDVVFGFASAIAAIMASQGVASPAAILDALKEEALDSFDKHVIAMAHVAPGAGHG